MTTIGVTGPDGFLGWHVRAYLRAAGISTVVADRKTMADADRLSDFVRQSDVVFHLAGVNRGSDDDVASGNIELAVRLVDAMNSVAVPRNVVYANSRKSGDESAYGQSKAAAGEKLASCQKELGAGFVDMKLPHLFGEHGRPFYNSGVATFAHQLAVGDQPEIKVDTELELLHAQDAAALMMSSIEEPAGPVEPSGRKLLVSEALELLKQVSRPYIASATVPELKDRFEVRMFNMFRSHLFPASTPVPLVVHRDQRGRFFESIRSHGRGQASVSTTAPGATRGDHFHFDKIERFVVATGEARIRVRRLFDDKVHEYRASGESPVAIDMPTLHAHNITNSGSRELVTLLWTNDLFDPEHPDTISEPV